MYGPGAFDDMCCSSSGVTGELEDVTVVTVAGGLTELANAKTDDAGGGIDSDDAEH